MLYIGNTRYKILMNDVPASFMLEPAFPDIPYVMSGLVHMYDGIWNGGRGIHNDSATVWKDCVGSNDLDCHDVSWNTVSGIFVSTSYALSSQTIPIDPNQELTYEFVIKVNTAHNWTFLFELESQEDNYGGYIYSDGRIRPFRWYDSTQTVISQSQTTGTFDIAVTISNRTEKAYLNGVLSAEGRTGNSTRDKKIYFFYSPRGSRYLDGNVFCLRIYNRALTGEEIAYNYQIDQRRFSL